MKLYPDEVLVFSFSSWGEDGPQSDHLFGRIKFKGDKCQCSVRIID